MNSHTLGADQLIEFILTRERKETLNKGGVNWGKYKIYLISSFKFVFLTFTSSSFYEVNTVKHMVSDKIEFKKKLRNSLIKKDAIRILQLFSISISARSSTKNHSYSNSSTTFLRHQKF